MPKTGAIIEKNQLARRREEWKARGGKFHIFDWLNALFHKINEDFNGEIFKPHLSEEIKIDSEILARIIERLYPPKSPYRFDVIGVELLGSIYERYLGKTIRPTAKRCASRKSRKSARRAASITRPSTSWITSLKTRSAKSSRARRPSRSRKSASSIPPAAPARSSSARSNTLSTITSSGIWSTPKEARHAHPSLDFMREVHTDPTLKRLSVYRKASILRNNLFGVDIDPQAVEITMMSLYLKALEGEKSQLPPKHTSCPS